MGLLNRCVRCGGPIGAIPGGIWVEALGGEVCLTCYEEIAAASEGLEPGQPPVIPPLEGQNGAAPAQKGRRALRAEPENEDLRLLHAQLERIRRLLMIIAAAVTVAAAALVIHLWK